MSDPKLPGLARALDEKFMRALLAATLGRELHLEENFFPALRCRILKHAPGKRCVIVYELDDGPRRFIGKIYRKNRGEMIFANWRLLWQSADAQAARTGEPLGMPEPLVYFPELGMVLQRAVPGRPLTEKSTDADWRLAMRCIGRNLATLHGLPPVMGEKKTLADHLQKYCHPGPQALCDACPELAPLVTTILRGLAAQESSASVPACPVHGDLNLAQIFIAGEQAWFVDFDGLCLTDPALDVGNFLVTLQVHHEPAYESLSEIFLEEYKARRPLQMLAGLRTYQAFACLRRAMICTRAPAVPAWRQQARHLLEAGSIFLKNEFGF